MTKREFIAALAERANLSIDRVEEVLTHAHEIIVSEMERGGPVKVPHLGTFKRVHKRACTRRNPKTGEAIEIPAYDAVVMSINKNLRGVLRS